MKYFSFLFFLYLVGCTTYKSSSPTPIAYTLPCQQRQYERDSPLAPTRVLTISEIVADGSYVILSDNSIWAIAPFDTYISAEWLTPAEITIKPSNHPQYPYLLYNHLSQDTIYARKASQEEIRQKMQQLEMEKKQKALEQQKMEEKRRQLQPATPPQPKEVPEKPSPPTKPTPPEPQKPPTTTPETQPKTKPSNQQNQEKTTIPQTK
jgi:hypothetical protein